MSISVNFTPAVMADFAHKVVQGQIDALPPIEEREKIAYTILWAIQAIGYRGGLRNSDKIALRTALRNAHVSRETTCHIIGWGTNDPEFEEAYQRMKERFCDMGDARFPYSYTAGSLRNMEQEALIWALDWVEKLNGQDNKNHTEGEK